MYSFVKLIIVFLTEIHGYHRISNRMNDLYFANEYFIVVHNKIVLNRINTETVFDEMWYIVEYFMVTEYRIIYGTRILYE